MVLDSKTKDELHKLIRHKDIQFKHEVIFYVMASINYEYVKQNNDNPKC